MSVIGESAVETPPAPSDAGKTAAPPAPVDEKAAAPAPVEPKVDTAAKPELFTDIKQLKLADGLKLDEAVMASFLPVAKELGLTAAQAQKLVEFSANGNKAFAESQAAAKATAAKAAVEAIKSDKEIGGANFEKSQKLAAKALSHIGNPELNKAFDSIELADGSMLGDNVLVMKVLVGLGRKLSEDSTAGTTQGASKTPGNDNATFLKKLYGEKPGHLKFD